MNTKSPIRYRYALALLLALGLRSSLPAQTTPSAAVTPPPDNETIVLSPFTVDVTKDNGYVAVNSLAGGRNNTPVVLTPSSMSSLTAAFIDDLQLTDVRSALRWTLNALPVSWLGGHEGGGDVFNSWSYNIRGAGVGPQGGNPPTVNYFPFYGVKDLFNVERVEVDRGPNSILFGVGNLGGTLSTYTKTPRFDQSFSNLNLTFSSFGAVRVAADSNQVSSLFSKNDFGVRVNLLADHDQGWRKADLTKKYGGSVATNLKISDNTSVRVDVEAFKQQTPQFAENVTDQYSQWDGKTSSATWGAAPTGGTAGTSSMAEWGGPASTLIWIPSQGTLMNWGAGYRGTGLGDGPFYTTAVLRPSSYVLQPMAWWPAGTFTVPALPSRDFTVGPKDGLFTWEYYTLNAYFDQRINANMEFELSAYRYADNGEAKNFESPGSVSVDINKQLPNGTPNPGYGKLYSDMFLDRQIQDHSANEVRAQLNYHFNTTAFNVPVKQWLSVSAGAEMHQLSTRQYIATSMAGYSPNNWTANMIWAREYWDSPNTSINVPATFNGAPIAYIGLPFNWFDHNLTEKIQYVGLASQTNLWDDRLNITLGARHDKYASNLLNIRGTGNVPSIENDAGTTYSAGLVGFITKDLALVYNYSQNFAPIGGGVAPSLFGTQFGPATGKSNTVGLRLSTDDHKYYVTGSYYEDTAHGRISNDSVGFQSIWNDYFFSGGTATDIGPAGTVTGGPGTLHANMSFADTEDVKGTGYEFEATANPTDNLRLQVGYSVPKSVSDNDLPGSRVYYAAHLAEWQAVANGTGPNHGQVATDLTNAANTLANTRATPTNAGVVKYTFNIFGVYTFTDDWAKGLSVGGGATALGAQNISTGGTMSSPGYTTYNALFAYETKFDTLGDKIRVKFQLNIDNLFDNKDLVYTGFNQNAAGMTQGSNFYFLEPRKFTFSANFKF
ncbi:MAG: TonB-dependent siderophore receptor [Opitutales bacterium]